MIQLPPLSLYVHLPWCERKCPYCDFNSHECNTLPEHDYLQALFVDLRNDQPMAQGRLITSIFIGGGTPSLFSAKSIATLIGNVSDVLPQARELEITIEANPGSAEAEKFCALREAGVNRLSLGVQSFQDDSLAALGRVHDSEQAHSAIQAARDAEFVELNLDLMHGLPQQTPEGAMADIDTAVHYAPAHLSWYQLTIEPNTPFYSHPPKLPCEEVLGDIQEEGEARLAAAGYRQYEVSAFAQPAARCQHNLNYWQFGDYLGIGAGAHSKITFEDGSVRRFAKRRQPKEYMAATVGEHVANSRRLAADELVGEFVMNALRLRSGFRLEHFSAVTGLSPQRLEPQLKELDARGLILRDEDHVRASQLGYRYLDAVVAEFF